MIVLFLENQIIQIDLLLLIHDTFSFLKAFLTVYAADVKK